jgi:GGDEF domain-containing protein
MRFRRTIVFHSPVGMSVPATVATFARQRGLDVAEVRETREIVALVNQSFPLCIISDGSGGAESIRMCETLKSDPFTAIVPLVFMLPEQDTVFLLSGLQAGADEVLTPAMGCEEQVLRLGVTLDRADRDVSVHPTTRLPGTAQIERDMAERLRRGETFAVCYADLDHFKEFNDRYGYNEGDGVILLLSRILRDIVRGRAPGGFVGHIGGDDFIFNVSIEYLHACCTEVIEVFDELIPYQYNEDDRKAGYFLGKDRRGNVNRIPLMTLSIGVVTNQYRRFTHSARISELATEMKTYAKTLEGSVYTIDRRRDVRPKVVAGPPSDALPSVLEEQEES